MRLLFDLDGTLTDPFVGITKCFRHALKALGRPAPLSDTLHWCIGPPLKDVLARLLSTDDSHLIDRAVDAYRERFSSVGLFENAVYPGIESALERLQDSGYTMSVATSKPTIYAERIVEHFGLTKFFCAVDGCELDGTRSDKVSLISAILERDAFSPADAIMIGDREHDMIGARENQVTGVGVLWGYGSRDELESAGASTCLEHPEQLTAVTTADRPGSAGSVPSSAAD